MKRDPRENRRGAAERNRAHASDTAPGPLQGFTEALRGLAVSLGLSLYEEDPEHPGRIRIEFAEGFPMWIAVDLDPGRDEAHVFGVVRTMGLPGDRSDYHDLISSVWAIGLRTLGVASVRLVDVPHPVVEGELYGRYVLFDLQPAVTYTLVANPDLDTLGRILSASAYCAWFFSAFYRKLRGGREEEVYDGEGGLAWAAEVAKTLRLKAEHRYGNSSQRHHPDWSYYHRDDHGITAFRFEAPLPGMLPFDPAVRDPTIIGTDEGLLVSTGSINNFVPSATVDVLVKLLRAYGRVLKPVTDGLHLDEETILVPVESHLFCVTAGGIIALRRECGGRTFIDERGNLIRKHQAISKWLFPAVRFRWNHRLDAEQYERLILELLNVEPGVTWARKVGHASASDAGRDIVAEWVSGPAPWQRADPESPMVRRRIIVQCKGYGKPVSLADIPDVPVLLDFHGADGYLLVAHPRITTQVVDYFANVAPRRQFWADWWTQDEVEERLRMHLEIARRYPELLTIIEVDPGQELDSTGPHD